MDMGWTWDGPHGPDPMTSGHGMDMGWTGPSHVPMAMGWWDHGMVHPMDLPWTWDGHGMDHPMIHPMDPSHGPPMDHGTGPSQVHGRSIPGWTMDIVMDMWTMDPWDGPSLGWTWDGHGMDMGWTWDGPGMDMGWTWDGHGRDLGRTWDVLGGPGTDLGRTCPGPGTDQVHGPGWTCDGHVRWTWEGHGMDMGWTWDGPMSIPWTWDGHGILGWTWDGPGMDMGWTWDGHGTDHGPGVHGSQVHPMDMGWIPWTMDPWDHYHGRSIPGPWDVRPRGSQDLGPSHGPPRSIP